MKRTLLSSCSLVLAIAVHACGGTKQESAATPAPAAVASDAAAAPSPGATPATAAPIKVGDQAKCPVSGEAFVVTDASPKAEYEGKTYYFCCASCAKSFQADPKKYAN